MAEPKVQLVAPIGNLTVPGMNVTGVVTASYSNVGVASSIIQGNNIDIGAGIITASSFVGDQIGTYRAGSLTGTPDLVVGVVTSSGLIGNITGDITGNLTGNVTGTAGSIISGNNLWVGIATGTLVGPGGNLTGIAATSFNTQTVAAIGAATTIDLSAGNMITFNQNANTTVSLANTSDAMDITFVRPGGDRTIAISFAAGAVDFDGSDYLSVTGPGDLGTDTDFTQEAWAYISEDPGNAGGRIFSSNQSVNATQDTQFRQWSDDWEVYAGQGSGNRFEFTISGGASIGWHHLALCREGNTCRFFDNGVLQGEETASHNVTITTHVLGWGIGSEYFTGKISSARFVKGRCLYTRNFCPPTEDLTIVTGTTLLCCQSTSSATASAITPGTITATGDPTAGVQTISIATASYPTSGTITWPSSIKWNGGTAPTIISVASSTNELQQFQFITADTGLNWYAWENFKDDPLNLKLFSWGGNTGGYLGQNNTSDYSSPTQVGTSANWQAASSHSLGGCAIKSDGTLWAWGTGSSGQNAQNNTTNYSSPVQVGGNKNWKSLQWGNNTCWALTSPGTMYCWGINPAGQFGSGTVIPQSSPIQIGESGIWSSVQQAGNGTGAAVKKAGGLWRWGANNNGELGMNSRTYYSSPIQIGSGTWKSFGGGTSYNIAVDGEGKLYGMGRNNVGNIGQNSSTARFSSPVQIGTGSDWASVTGGRFWCAALKTDGTLYAWGVNDKGQLGQNSRLPSDNTGYSSPVQIPGTWSHIRGHNNGFYGGKSDGTMWVWGGNYNGGLGRNTTAPDGLYSSPTQLPGTWNVANTSYYAQAGSMIGLKVP